MSPNPAKAPWYFMGLQELLVHLHPAFAVLVVPLLAPRLLAALPLPAYGEAPAGRTSARRPGCGPRLAAAARALVLTPAACSPTRAMRRGRRPWIPSPAAGGPHRAVFRSCSPRLLAGLYLAARRLLRASRLEAVQALFVFVMVASWCSP